MGEKGEVMKRMLKKDFIALMDSIAKISFKADHIEFKEFKGWSSNKANFVLELGNHGDLHMSVEYFRFEYNEVGKLWSRKDLLTLNTIEFCRRE